MNNRFPPRELFWQHYQLTERDVKHGDLIFDSDKLLFPVKQYLYLFDIDAFDEYALVAYNFLLAQAEMYEEKLDLLVDSNRITRDFRIRVFYDKNTWAGRDGHGRSNSSKKTGTMSVASRCYRRSTRGSS